MFPLTFSCVFAQKFVRVQTLLFFLPSKIILLTLILNFCLKNVVNSKKVFILKSCVRTSFLCALVLAHNLYARAHAHRLEGTLVLPT